VTSQSLLDSLVASARPLAALGRPADYIPALAQADPGAIGGAVMHVDGSLVVSGDARLPFSLQSVSKALALPYVIDSLGEDVVFSRVGKEPTGDPFNSIIRLEASQLKRPYNPMINAGAMVVTSLMPGATVEEKLKAFSRYAAPLLGMARLDLDPEIRDSEAATANRNRSIAWFLRDLGLLGAEVELTLDAYFGQCAFLVDAVGLAHYGAVLARDGLEPGSGQRLMSPRAARVTKGLMQSCGLYDGSGEFCVEAGLPAKSGVGGGILASARNRLGIGTYGPALDIRGNSLAGIHIIKGLSESLDLFCL